MPNSLKLLSAAALVGAFLIPMLASAQWGGPGYGYGGPGYGYGGPGYGYGGPGYGGPGYGRGMGDMFGDFDMSARGSGRGHGYGRGEGDGYGYGRGYGYGPGYGYGAPYGAPMMPYGQQQQPEAAPAE